MVKYERLEKSKFKITVWRRYTNLRPAVLVHETRHIYNKSYDHVSNQTVLYWHQIPQPYVTCYMWNPYTTPTHVFIFLFRLSEFTFFEQNQIFFFFVGTSITKSNHHFHNYFYSKSNLVKPKTWIVNQPQI